MRGLSSILSVFSNKFNQFSHFSTKTYVVGTQKNRLHETVLLSTQNICYKLWVRNIYNFTQNISVNFKPVSSYTKLLLQI